MQKVISMGEYVSKYTGPEIDNALKKVVDGKAGIQGVKVNGTEVTPDNSNKVNVEIPNISQTTGSSTTSVMSQDAITTQLNNKVDKVSGKGLSTEDFTTSSKNKLAGIETGATKNTVVQSTGSSTSNVMSQNAVSNALNSKQDKISNGYVFIVTS